MKKKKQLQNNSLMVVWVVSKRTTYTPFDTNAKQCETRHTNRNIIRVDRAAQRYSNWHRFYCTIGDAQIYSSIGHLNMIFHSHISIDLKHPNVRRGFFSPLLLLCIFDHYAFSLANNQDKSYLTLPFDRQHFGTQSLYRVLRLKSIRPASLPLRALM